MRRSTLGYVILALAIVLGLYWQNGISQDGRRSREALCVIEAKVQRDVRKAEGFLRKNPNGIPGISTQLIRDGIKDDHETLRALSPLGCPD